MDKRINEYKDRLLEIKNRQKDGIDRKIDQIGRWNRQEDGIDRKID